MSELTYSGSFSNGKATPIFREQKEILCRRMLSYMHFLLKEEFDQKCHGCIFYEGPG